MRPPLPPQLYKKKEVAHARGGITERDRYSSWWKPADVKRASWVYWIGRIALLRVWDGWLAPNLVAGSTTITAATPASGSVVVRCGRAHVQTPEPPPPWTTVFATP